MEGIAVCGSVRGYLAHLWRRTQPCELCRIAWHLFSDRPPPRNALKQFDRDWIASR